MPPPQSFPDTMPMTIQPRSDALHVIGIELRTTNREAAQTIPPFWQRFAGEGLPARLPERLSDDVYAVYTHFEHAGLNNDGCYSLVIGLAMPASAGTPPGLVRATIPAGPEAVFSVEAGRPDRVAEGWQVVWQRADLPKTFIADHERYQADGGISIHVGLRSTDASLPHEAADGG